MPPISDDEDSHGQTAPHTYDGTLAGDRQPWIIREIKNPWAWVALATGAFYAWLICQSVM